MDSINIKAFTKNSSQILALKAFMKALKIKFEVSKEVPEETPYNADFVAKIEESRKEARAGKTVKIALDDIWK